MISAASSHVSPSETPAGDLPVALVTGASAGLGRAIAEHLSNHGYHVFAASRRIDAWEGCANPQLTPLAMDVTDDASVGRGVDQVLQQTGRLDVVVNNAGYGVAGPFEETPLAAGRAQMETNFFGAARLCHAVLPIMRAQHGGAIVNISSIGGRLGLPFQSYYSASKFALEGLSEAMRYELEPHNVRVTLLEPGNFATQFTQNRQVYGGVAGSAYAAACQRAVAVMVADERGGSAPQQVAEAVLRAVRQPQPPLRRAVGPFLEVLGVWLSSFLPRRLFDWAYRKVVGVA